MNELPSTEGLDPATNGIDTLGELALARLLICQPTIIFVEKSITTAR